MILTHFKLKTLKLHLLMIKYNIQFKGTVTIKQSNTLKQFLPTLQCLQAAEVETLRF